MLDLVDQLPEQVHKGKFPVIAVEGLDATGNITFWLQARRDIDLSWEQTGLHKYNFIQSSARKLHGSVYCVPRTEPGRRAMQR